jgi:hypothetical protein
VEGYSILKYKQYLLSVSLEGFCSVELLELPVMWAMAVIDAVDGLFCNKLVRR